MPESKIHTGLFWMLVAGLLGSKIFGGGDKGEMDFAASSTLAGNTINSGLREFNGLKVPELLEMKKDMEASGRDAPTQVFAGIFKKQYKDILEGAKTFSDVEAIYAKNSASERLDPNDKKTFNPIQGDILPGKIGKNDVQLVVQSYDPEKNQISVNYYTKGFGGIPKAHSETFSVEVQDGKYVLGSANKKGKFSPEVTLDGLVLHTEKLMQNLDREYYDQKRGDKFADPYAPKTPATPEPAPTVSQVPTVSQDSPPIPKANAAVRIPVFGEGLDKESLGVIASGVTGGTEATKIAKIGVATYSEGLLNLSDNRVGRT
jgi:hypothetical protein